MKYYLSTWGFRLGFIFDTSEIYSYIASQIINWQKLAVPISPLSSHKSYVCITKYLKCFTENHGLFYVILPFYLPSRYKQWAGEMAQQSRALLFFLRTWVSFPTLHGDSQPSVTPVSGDSNSPFRLLKHNAHKWWTDIRYTCRQNFIYTHKIITFNL